MYLFGDVPIHAQPLLTRLQEIPVQLLNGLEPCGPSLEFDGNADLNTALPDNQLFLLEEGLIDISTEERQLFYLQQGSLVGLRHGLNLPAWHYTPGEPVRLTPYERRAFFQHVYSCEQRQELFTFYLLGQTTLLTEAFARVQQVEVNPSTGFEHFAPGEKLIHQGDSAEHVFVIIEGHAEAWVDGQKVGDVQKDEIFGAMAVFINEPRTATVVATEPCTVMTIPKDQFLALMQSNPRIAHSLIESMARRIDLMNKEITHLRTQVLDRS